jgi:opacity protein-like surface antigen
MRIQQIGLLVLLPCCFAGAGIAQNTPRFELFAEGGDSFLNTGPPTGSLIISCPNCTLSQIAPLSGSTILTAWRLSTGARFRFTRHDAIEASYSFSPNHFTYHTAGLDVESGHRRLDVFSVNYVRYLWVRSRFQPFATAGVGTNRFKGRPNIFLYPIGPHGFTIDFPNPGNSGWQFAWNYGAGADFILQRHFALRVELRNYVSDQPLPLTGTSHNIVPSAGIVFRFR